ncbi:MAG: hypothetical protein R2774_06470 [Saprospiraceae bacterium]
MQVSYNKHPVQKSISNEIYFIKMDLSHQKFDLNPITQVAYTDIVNETNSRTNYNTVTSQVPVTKTEQKIVEGQTVTTTENRNENYHNGSASNYVLQ